MIRQPGVDLGREDARGGKTDHAAWDKPQNSYIVGAKVQTRTTDPWEMSTPYSRDFGEMSQEMKNLRRENDIAKDLIGKLRHQVEILERKLEWQTAQEGHKNPRQRDLPTEIEGKRDEPGREFGDWGGGDSEKNRRSGA